MKITITVIFMLFIIYMPAAYESVFDRVTWIKADYKNGTNLYMQNESGVKINFYKAEKKLKNINAEILIKNLTDFNKYPEIFPRTVSFKIIKELAANTYLIYSVMDFRPFKNRDYYVVLRYDYIRKNGAEYEFYLEWFPASFYDNKFDFDENERYLRVKDVYGRWKIRKTADDEIYISVEYYNDFIMNVPLNILSEFERSSTINAVNLLLKYSNMQ